MIRFGLTLAALVAASGLCAAPATAKGNSDIGPEVSLGEIFDTYKLVCVAHPGDPDGQIAATKALPGKFEESDRETDGTRTFRNGRLLVRVLDSSDLSMCGASGVVAPKTKPVDGAKVGSVLFGDASKLNERSYFWSRGEGSDLVTYVFSLYDRTDWLEAAFLMGSEK